MDPQYNFPILFLREGPRPGPSGQRKEYPPGGLHYASLRSGPSHFATLRLTTSPLWAPPPTLVRGCTSPLEGIPSAVPGSHPYYRPFLRTNPGLRPSHPCFGLFLRTRPGFAPSLLLSPLKHTYPVQPHLQDPILCFNYPFNTRLKHTYPVQIHLQGSTLCFNSPFNTHLKHTCPVLSRVQGLTLCFNAPFNTHLKHTYPVQTYLQCLVLCFNAGMLPEGKRNPLGPFHGAREGFR